MKKCVTIGVVVGLVITFFVPPLSAQAQYSYRFEKFLELIDYYYLQPNNLSREQMEKECQAMPFLIADALERQNKYQAARSFALYKEFKKDIGQYIRSYYKKNNLRGFPILDCIDIIEMIANNSYSPTPNEKVLKTREEVILNRFLGNNFRFEGEWIPSFEQWARDGYPPFEVEVRPLPPPEPIIEKPPVQGKKAVRDDEKAIKLLEEEGEATEDLSIDNDYWPAAPDPSSAPDFDEFLEDQ